MDAFNGDSLLAPHERLLWFKIGETLVFLLVVCSFVVVCCMRPVFSRELEQPANRTGANTSSTLDGVQDTLNTEEEAQPDHDIVTGFF